ncbi:MAG TPA: anthranilate phosphoribosyltransferase [Candidatus Paceibacterota bacterium]|nr:anthranilate phosphoribosyltransferase [Candidatus Paceibacterota bacterium]HRZ53865.1 anthranilate phosphoribosyltransferase [Candidatus Paceibacterota bacterium]
MAFPVGSRYRPPVLDKLTAHVRSGLAMSGDEAAAAVACLLDESLSVETKADFLSALSQKGETADEIAAFARFLRGKAIAPPLDTALRNGGILDVVGTGGDRAGTFNISTAAALVAASAGVKVAKHGNRAVTCQTGSADVIEALGIPIDLPPERAVSALRDHGFAFFFAPLYHPAFNHIAPVRRLCADRGQRTLFNYLGPLLNPVCPTAQVMGVPRPDLCAPLARVLQALGVRRGIVVCGRTGLATGAMYFDELSILGDTTIAEFYQERGMHCSTLRRTDFPIQPAVLPDLQGGDRAANAETLRRVLRGDERGPKRDAVLLNAGAALFVADRVRTVADGWEAAAELIDSGRAWTKLEELRISR